VKRGWCPLVWTHAPAVGLWVGFLIWFLVWIPNGAIRVPLRIDSSGAPVAWGSSWIAFALVLGLGLFFIGISAFLDALWAQQESRKRFNLLSLLDELILGLMVPIQMAFLMDAAAGATVYRIPVVGLVAGVCGMLILGGIVEWARPYVPGPIPTMPMSTDAEGFRTYLEGRIEASEPVVYWDIQNPRYVTWLSIGLPLVLWAAAGFLFRTQMWIAWIEALIGLMLLLYYGGQRTRVSQAGITIRYGLTGLRIFRCALSDIAGIRVRTFAPLAEFGGYGIRIAHGVTAYYLAGRTGVQIERVGRRSVLIGSTHPMQLAVVLSVLTGNPITSETGNEVSS
jgi:hypothetical protein